MAKGKLMGSNWVSVIIGAIIGMFLMLLSATSWASRAPRIVDERHLLERVDASVGKQDFNAAFRCGDRADYSTLTCVASCSNLWCDYICPDERQRVAVRVTDCDSTGVVLRPDGGEAGILLKAEYDLLHGNMLRQALAQIPELEPSRNFLALTHLLENLHLYVDGRDVEAVELIGRLYIYSLKDKKYRSLEFVAYVAKTLPGVAQVIGIVIDGSWVTRLEKVTWR
jgi:hypothetical protein